MPEMKEPDCTESFLFEDDGKCSPWQLMCATSTCYEMFPRVNCCSAHFPTVEMIEGLASKAPAARNTARRLESRELKFNLRAAFLLDCVSCEA